MQGSSAGNYVDKLSLDSNIISHNVPHYVLVLECQYFNPVFILSYPILSKPFISYAIFLNPLTLIFVVIKMTLHLPKRGACPIQNGTLQSQTKINFSIFKSKKKKPQMKIINFKKQKHDIQFILDQTIAFYCCESDMVLY